MISDSGQRSRKEQVKGILNSLNKGSVKVGKALTGERAQNFTNNAFRVLMGDDFAPSGRSDKRQKKSKKKRRGRDIHIHLD